MICLIIYEQPLGYILYIFRDTPASHDKGELMFFWNKITHFTPMCPIFSSLLFKCFCIQTVLCVLFYTILNDNIPVNHGTALLVFS